MQVVSVSQHGSVPNGALQLPPVRTQFRVDEVVVVVADVVVVAQPLDVQASQQLV